METSRLKGKELEKQREAELRIARQRLQIETQTQLRILKIQQLEENHRKQVAAAALEEIELLTKPSSDRSSSVQTSELFIERSSLKGKKLVQNWVNSSPAVNKADVASKPSLHLSRCIAQPSQANVPRPSSTQHLNSHSKHNTDGQAEANTNIPVQEPQEPSRRTNLTKNAHFAKNIMQEQQQPQYTPPSAPKNFGLLTHLDAQTHPEKFLKQKCSSIGYS